MTDDPQSLAAEHHAFYEILPYYVLADGTGGSSQRVQSGFDVDIYGVSTRNELAPPRPDSDYEKGYVEVQKLVDEISHDTGGQYSVEVIPFTESAFLDAQDHKKVEARIRIRISHLGPLEEPAGEPEKHALQEVENRLKGLGIGRR
jgi:hypothetical protein